MFEDFGNSQSGLEQVQSFYRFWGSCGTYKSFSWCDGHNVNEAPNRWVKRQMDKENKKERQNEKRQYVKTLKELVEFCKRRDPRWKDYLESIRKEEEKKKEEIKLKKEEDTKRKQDTKIRARKEEEERWAELDAAKELENNEKTNILQDDDDNEYIEEFYCEICNKGFKSEGQLLNHHNSKGHKKQMKDLIESVGNSQEKEQFYKEIQQAQLLISKTVEIPTISKKKKNKKKQQNILSKHAVDSSNSSSSDNECPSQTESELPSDITTTDNQETKEKDESIKDKRTKGDKKSKLQEGQDKRGNLDEQSHQTHHSDNNGNNDNDDDDDDWASVKPKTKKKQSKQNSEQLLKKKVQQSEDLDKRQKDVEENSQQKKQEKGHLKSKNKNKEKGSESSCESDEDNNLTRFAQNIKRKVDVNNSKDKEVEEMKCQDKGKPSKKSQGQKDVAGELINDKLGDKVYNKAMKNKKLDVCSTKDGEVSEEMNKAKVKKEKKKEKDEQDLAAFKCNVCPLRFLTKNKLFTHLKESGHQLKI